MSTKELKPYLLLITYAGAVFLAVTHLDRILNQDHFGDHALYHRAGHRLCAQPSL